MCVFGLSLIGSGWVSASAEHARTGYDAWWTTENQTAIRVAGHITNIGMAAGLAMMGAPMFSALFGAVGGAMHLGATGMKVLGGLALGGMATYSGYDIASNWAHEDWIDRFGRIGMHLAAWVGAGIGAKYSAGAFKWGYAKGAGFRAAVLDLSPVAALRAKYGLTRSELRAVIASWDQGTLPTRAASIRYHFEKHGGGLSLLQYTMEAQAFYARHAAIAEWGQWNPNWAPSFRVIAEGYKGYFTAEGKILTYFLLE